MNRRTACSTIRLTEVPDAAAFFFSCAKSRSSSVIVVRMMHDRTVAASLHQLVQRTWRQDTAMVSLRTARTRGEWAVSKGRSSRLPARGTRRGLRLAETGLRQDLVEPFRRVTTAAGERAGTGWRLPGFSRDACQPCLSVARSLQGPSPEREDGSRQHDERGGAAEGSDRYARNGFVTFTPS